jgi:CubicO group peptidase (beta-lactamase class C family)
MFRILLSFAIIGSTALPSLLFSTEEINSAHIQKIIPKLEKFIVEGMSLSHVPGVAIAIVYQDDVLYLNGFGLRDVEKNMKVTPRTVFQLASVSKPITSTILASLVSKGKIQWQSKIENLNPSFRLSDPWVTAHLTIKDLLSHRSGLPDHAGDILEDLGYDQDLILHQLRYIKPLQAFREHYAYTNFGYSEAAYATSHFLKTSWDDLAKTTLFNPLGMDDTSYSYEDYQANPQKATTYVIGNEKAIPLSPPRAPDAQRPAGGVSSSAQDIAKWMILQMGGFKDKDIVDPKVLSETQSPVILTGINDKNGLPSFYGMGWGVSYDQDGRYFLKHSGAFSLGVRTQVVLLPDEKLGIAVITNASPSALPEAISTTFYDLLFTGTITDGIVEKYNELWMKFQVEPQAKFAVNPDSYTPSLKPEKYLGKYSNDYYGLIEIRKKENDLELIIGPKEKTFLLKHLNRDVFTFQTEGENAVGETQVIFTIDEADSVRQLTIDYLNQFGMGIFMSHTDQQNVSSQQ